MFFPNQRPISEESSPTWTPPNTASPSTTPPSNQFHPDWHTRPFLHHHHTHFPPFTAASSSRNNLHHHHVHQFDPSRHLFPYNNNSPSTSNGQSAFVMPEMYETPRFSHQQHMNHMGNGGTNAWEQRQYGSVNAHKSQYQTHNEGMMVGWGKALAENPHPPQSNSHPPPPPPAHSGWPQVNSAGQGHHEFSSVQYSVVERWNATLQAVSTLSSFRSGSTAVPEKPTRYTKMESNGNLKHGEAAAKMNAMGHPPNHISSGFQENVIEPINAIQEMYPPKLEAPLSLLVSSAENDSENSSDRCDSAIENTDVEDEPVALPEPACPEMETSVVDEAVKAAEPSQVIDVPEIVPKNKPTSLSSVLKEALDAAGIKLDEGEDDVEYSVPPEVLQRVIVSDSNDSQKYCESTKSSGPTLSLTEQLHQLINRFENTISAKPVAMESEHKVPPLRLKIPKKIKRVRRKKGKKKKARMKICSVNISDVAYDETHGASVVEFLVRNPEVMTGRSFECKKCGECVEDKYLFCAHLKEHLKVGAVRNGGLAHVYSDECHSETSEG